MHHLRLEPISVAYHENHKGAVSVVSAASDRRVCLFIIRLMVEIALQLYLNPLSCNVAAMLVKKKNVFIIFLPFFPPQTSMRHQKNLVSVPVAGLALIQYSYAQSERQTGLTFLI